MSTLAASLMTMRAEVTRKAEGKDSYGGKAAGNAWQIVSPEERCFVWIKTRKAVTDGGKVVVVEDASGIFRADADLQTGDRLTFFDRRDRDLFGGDTFEVDAGIVDKYAGAIVVHREAMLRRYRA